MELSIPSHNRSSGPVKLVRLAGTARAPGNETYALDPTEQSTPTRVSSWRITLCVIPDGSRGLAVS